MGRTQVSDVNGVLERHGEREGRRLRAAPAVLCLVLGAALAGCGDISRFQTAAVPATVATPKPKPAVTQTPATEKEHERILASYGGTYDDPRLEALVTKTVDRLVAASERPDQGYRVTILNSGAVNAFALPNGQLYVTRGLLALASDTSGNTALGAAVEEARAGVREGGSLGELLRASGLFPPLLIRMIAVGERSGELEPMLIRVADAYEQEVDSALSTLTSVLEPAMIVIMGGLVLFIVLAVLLPIFEINSLVG